MTDPINIHPNGLLTEVELLRKLKRHVASLERLSTDGGVARPTISMELSTAKRLIEMAELANIQEPVDVTPRIEASN